MNKAFMKLILKILLLALILWTILAILISNFEMYIYDGEYASYKETLDYIKQTNDYNKIIIWGDSVAKAAILPTEISEETYNFAMPGISPIEQYYMMEEYLKNHEKPQTILMMYSMAGYNQDTIDNFFWNRTVYFDCLTVNQFADIIKTGLFPNSFDAVLNFFQYKTNMPNKYYAAIKNSFIQRRYETNIDRYNYNREHKGHQYFGIEKEYLPNNVSICEKKGFRPLEIMEYYLFKCIEMCQEKDIQLIILQNPVNLSTYTNLQEKFITEYTQYMQNLEKKYEGIIVDANIKVEADSWFGDYVHLNPHGATQFTTKIKENYSEYLY